MGKYFKPTSLTWWASVVPIVAGVFIAAEPLHEMTLITQSVQDMFGGATPGMLINAGLAGIGLRGAVS
ncbi:MAG: hypothetical protein ACPG4X_20980 [Pikeienuella sp.]